MENKEKKEEVKPIKYFLDTEFHEYAKRVPFIGRDIDTIELISIGIVSDDERVYYGICKDFDLKSAWNNDWLRVNVLGSVYADLLKLSGVFGYGNSKDTFTYRNMKKLLKEYGKSTYEIRTDIMRFILDPADGMYDSNPLGLLDYWKYLKYKFVPLAKPQFYGYYADYDWVRLCWLFGRMIDLPKGFPKYCLDLKQMMFERELGSEWKNSQCPDPKGVHNALEDAKWNMKLYGKIMEHGKK